MSENLEIQERVFRKSFKSTLCNLKCQDTTHAIIEMENIRTQDLKDLENECTDIKKCLSTFTENIFSNDIQTHDIAEYKKNLVDIEKKINILKMNISKQREELEQKEKELVEEIITLKKLITSDETISIKPFNNLSAQNSKTYKQLPVSSNKEVEVFQTFLMKTGGHTGGWGNMEHGIFLHCWNKCCGEMYEETITKNSSTKLINIIQKKLPVLTQEEIEAHKMWYLKYLTLKESQTKSIEMWKAMKEVNKCYKKLAETGEKELQNDNINKITSSVKNIALEEWKKNKENEERLFLEQQALENIHDKEEQFNKIKMNRLTRQINKRWIESKKCEMEKAFQEEAEAVLQEKTQKAKEANKKIKEFRQRDQLIVSFRKSLINRNVNKFQTQKLMKNNTYSLTKKPQKFLRSKYHELTEQWRRRITKNESTESILPNSKAVCGVDHLPKLGMPKWRQGMV